jgi:hypothetical protein
MDGLSKPRAALGAGYPTSEAGELEALLDRAWPTPK